MFFQIVINSIINSLLIALVALGFNVVFSTTKIFHLAHGAIYTLSVYMFWAVCSLLLDGNPLLPSNILLASLFTIGMNLLLVLIIEKFVYKPLSEKSANPTITLIASMGIYLFIVNFISMIFSSENRILVSNVKQAINFNGILLTPIQIAEFSISAITIIIIGLVYEYSNLGLYIKTVKENSKVASAFGVNVPRVRIYALLMGSLLAAIAAILKGYDTGFQPYAGFGIVLTATVVVVLSGGVSVNSILFASFCIAIVQDFTEFFLSSEWKEPLTFFILLLVLLWKTEGIVSYNIRLEEQ
jgi:branched-chain amino acid transport system permease protein